MSVLLPLHATESEPAQQRSTALPAIARPLNILLAEDDSSVAGITQTMLAELGHRVICSSNAEQALQVLRSDTPLDVLMTDVIMPGDMDGVDLARAAVGMRSELGVLLCSGYAGESLEDSAVRSAWPLLRKPYLQGELAEALAQIASEIETLADSGGTTRAAR